MNRVVFCSSLNPSRSAPATRSNRAPQGSLSSSSRVISSMPPEYSDSRSKTNHQWVNLKAVNATPANCSEKRGFCVEGGDGVNCLVQGAGEACPLICLLRHRPEAPRKIHATQPKIPRRPAPQYTPEPQPAKPQ